MAHEQDRVAVIGREAAEVVQLAAGRGHPVSLSRAIDGQDRLDSR
jgi:hypothetical protein